jgi:organic hydroperoxide reductase OsmC/OhrA
VPRTPECFSMALALMLGQAGFVPRRIRTTAKVDIEEKGAHYIDRARGGKLSGTEQEGTEARAALGQENRCTRSNAEPARAFGVMQDV